ncbi:MAG: hypothetical protein F6J94_15860 [Moorea sp. SIO1F2]|uniref:hypothetical protein n=1 Tax=Moorena sp. SIO1F2 TaxID=2607819 RepID=UPI0013B71F34|nr:hypothetical protein [Moorena sp. SIO1F2]NET83336.1 hypothetical protein [Moorena sp. SIO1F2]
MLRLAILYSVIEINLSIQRSVVSGQWSVVSGQRSVLSLWPLPVTVVCVAQASSL